MKMRLRIPVFLLACMFIVIATGTGVAYAESETVELPYFLNQFEDTALDLRQFWGKAYLLFFFTEASEACAKQIPEIKRIYETYSPDALQIVMIHEWAGENEQNTQNVIDTFGLAGMTFFEDKDMSVARKINIPGCPMTIFMNEGGFLFDAFVYAVNYDMMADVLLAMEVPIGWPTLTESDTAQTPAPMDAEEALEPVETPAAEPVEEEEAPGGAPVGAIGVVETN